MVHHAGLVECAWLGNNADLLTEHIHQRGLFGCGKPVLTVNR